MSGFRRDVIDSRNDDRWFGDRLGDKFERRADYIWRADSRAEQCTWSKPEVAHGPLACDAVEEVMRPSREACASVRVEQMCCGIEATRDVPPCSADSSTEASTVLTQRPRLKLKPRSIPKEMATPPPAERSERITSIFGAARPVDTAAREREIEERLRQRGQGLKRPQSWRSNEDVGERRRSSDTSDASRSSRTASVGSSTGKGQQSRKESEAFGGDEVFSRKDEAQLFKSAQQRPPGPKVVPAPPPRENAWVKRSEMQNRRPIQQQLLPANSAQTSLNNLKTRVPNSAVESNTSTFQDKIIQVSLEDSGNEDADWQPEVLAPTKPKQLGVKIKHGSSRSKGRGRGVIAVKKDHRRKESRKELYSTKPKKYDESELPNFSSESTFAALRAGGDLDEAN
uniref:Uncharacterized protein n=1 Tax=Eptatretus burgeri TaxID=7764 RepID=A0A8C4PZI6_EPTBU